jgi:hypothetical protein
MPNGLQKIGMLHDVALGTDGRQDLWDLNWFAACGSECLWSCCRGPIMSDHVDIKRRFVQCFVLRLWRWREGCKRALSPTGRLGTACCPTQGPQGMVSANASQHTLEGMKISWVPSWALVPSKTCLQCTSACMHCSKKKVSSLSECTWSTYSFSANAEDMPCLHAGKKRTWIYMEIICLDTPRKEKDEEAIEGQRETAHVLRSKGFWCENEQRFQWFHSVLRDSPMFCPVKAPCRQCRQRRTEWVGVKKKM